MPYRPIDKRLTYTEFEAHTIGHSVRRYSVSRLALGTFGNTESMFWDTPGETEFPYLNYAGPKSVRVRVGGNAGDTSAGTGARRINILGLVDGLPSFEQIQLTGAAASAYTSKKFDRVFLAVVASVGSVMFNIGAITIEDDSGKALAYVAPGASLSTMAFYTVPMGYQMHMRSIRAWVEGNQSEVGITAYFRANALDVDNDSPIIKGFRAFDIKNTSPLDTRNEAGLALAAGTDFWITATGDSGGGTRTATLRYDAVLESNPDQ
jgi:hypothetical protein